MMKVIFISIVPAVIVFLVKFYIDYNRILFLGTPVNGVLPENFTSFPPSGAWITALPWAISVFALVFIVGWLFFRK